MHSCFFFLSLIAFQRKSIKHCWYLLELLVVSSNLSNLSISILISRNQYWPHRTLWLNVASFVTQMPEMVGFILNTVEINNNNSNNEFSLMRFDVYEIKSQFTLCFAIWLLAITDSQQIDASSRTHFVFASIFFL